eukprot:GEMP01058660.1.p1 GENE.GEMP01058660.1~~GEMP01058660.1.p1  ORF type:complete len:410 (+),score=10.59 GEMP01058660.1:178-1407(+)
MARIKELETMVDEARHTPIRSWYRKDRPRMERVNSEGNFLCYKCDAFQIPSAFYADWRKKYGRWSQCKACYLESMYRYQTLTLRGAFNKILHVAKSRAVKRSKIHGREEAGRFELDLNSLLNLWLNQQGRCFYSGLVMCLEPHTTWRFSVERRDNSLGYVPSNVVFICGEFNTSDRSIHAKCHVFGSPQWSREKVRSLPHIISGSNSLGDGEMSKLLAGASLVPRQRSPKREIVSNGYLFCGKCSQYKSPSEFPRRFNGLSGRNSNCSECHAQYRRSFLGFFRSKLADAKKFAKLRVDKGREEAGVCDLSLSDITALYERQRGLCFYSGARLTLKPLSDWMCSIERLNNTKGYTVDNVVLICSEFQTSDHSLYTKRSVKGTSQWSKEKVTTLLQWLKATTSASSKCFIF